MHSVMRAGDAGTFKAGFAVGHYLWNQSDKIARWLVIGTHAILAYC